MPADFLPARARNIGTAPIDVNAAVPASTRDIYLGLCLGNVAGASITVSAWIVSGGLNFYLTKDATMPAGATLELVESKLILTAGEKIQVQASEPNAVDVNGSYMRKT
jgi:hypothetical protein